MLDNVAVKIKTVNEVSTYEYIDNYNTDSDCTYWVVVIIIIMMLILWRLILMVF